MPVRIRLSRSIVPNLFTVLNIFFGFLSMIQAMQGRILPACWYIIFAAVCDALDGVMARLTKSSSEFGVELDSLADVVSFGAAPSVLSYALVMNTYGQLGLLLAAIPLVFGALRLARFNVQLVGFDKDYFVGVPTPLSALTLVSFIFFFTPELVSEDLVLQKLFTGLVVALGLLMVSTIRYPILPRFNRRVFREKPIQMSLTIVGGGIIIGTMGRALFPVLLSVLIFGIIMAVVRSVRKGLFGASAHRTRPEQSDSMTIDSHS